MFELFNAILNSKTWVNMEPLTKGWSQDKKWIITDAEKNKYLLRVFSHSLYEKKQQQFTLLKEIQKLNIYSSLPVDFGVLNENEDFMLLTYLEGEEGTSYLRTATDQEAYGLGYEAGAILKKIHGIKTDKPLTSWWEKYQLKIVRKIKIAEDCQLAFPHLDLLKSYVLNKMSILKNQPQTVNHGDFHIGNMIINHGHLGIIDFDKNEMADPFDDFKPFCWNVFASPYFETGLINGYFNKQIPENFFPILAVYAAESLISHLPWAIRFGEEEMKVAYQVMDAVFKWYDGFNRLVPTWYKGIIY